MKADSNDAPVGLPFAASVFGLAYAIVVLGDACTTVLLGASLLSEPFAAARYVITHFTTGFGLLAASLIGLVALKKRSSVLLVLGELVGGAALSTIVILETMSLWHLPYLE